MKYLFARANDTDTRVKNSSDSDYRPDKYQLTVNKAELLFILKFKVNFSYYKNKVFAI